jgi:hypothetical protein
MGKEEHENLGSFVAWRVLRVVGILTKRLSRMKI